MLVHTTIFMTCKKYYFQSFRNMNPKHKDLKERERLGARKILGGLVHERLPPLET